MLQKRVKVGFSAEARVCETGNLLSLVNIEGHFRQSVPLRRVNGSSPIQCQGDLPPEPCEFFVTMYVRERVGNRCDCDDVCKKYDGWLIVNPE